MLNHSTVTPTSLPLGRLTAIDQRAMRRNTYERSAKTATHSTNIGETSHLADRDPVSLASPFCNPEF